MTSKSILFAGGGTGGHIAPLLAVMEAVKKQDPSIKCLYVGTSSDLKSVLLKNSELDFESFSISAGKLHRFLTVRQLKETWGFFKGMIQAEGLIRKLKPNAVFCKGSMVSVPIAFAASRHGIPIYSHESDVIPGLANRLISKKAQTIFTSYPVSEYKKLPAEKLRYTGQPVRELFRNIPKRALRLDNRTVDATQPVISVIGGSQGARRINQLVSDSWSELLEKTQVIHICGSLEYSALLEKAQALPKHLQEKLFLLNFVNEELPQIFMISTGIISRAGGTIAELAAVKKTVILLPLSTAAQNHQVANARVLAEKDAAIVLDETTTTSSELAKAVMTLLDEPKTRKDLEQAIAQFDRPEAARDMANSILTDLGTLHG